jgi:hypothetical protein
MASALEKRVVNGPLAPFVSAANPQRIFQIDGFVQDLLNHIQGSVGSQLNNLPDVQVLLDASIEVYSLDVLPQVKIDALLAISRLFIENKNIEPALQVAALTRDIDQSAPEKIYLAVINYIKDCLAEGSQQQLDESLRIVEIIPDGHQIEAFKLIFEFLILHHRLKDALEVAIPSNGKQRSDEILTLLCTMITSIENITLGIIDHAIQLVNQMNHQIQPLGLVIKALIRLKGHDKIALSIADRIRERYPEEEHQYECLAIAFAERGDDQLAMEYFSLMTNKDVLAREIVAIWIKRQDLNFAIEMADLDDRFTSFFLEQCCLYEIGHDHLAHAYDIARSITDDDEAEKRCLVNVGVAFLKNGDIRRAQEVKMLLKLEYGVNALLE